MCARTPVTEKFEEIERNLVDFNKEIVTSFDSVYQPMIRNEFTLPCIQRRDLLPLQMVLFVN